MIEFLITQGMSVNSKDNENKTPLHYATEYSDMNTIKFLVEKGVDIGAIDDGGRTAKWWLYMYMEYFKMKTCPKVEYLDRCEIPLKKMRTMKEWRPWNHHKYPDKYQNAMKTLVCIAKC